MYENLVDYLCQKTVNQFPYLRQEPELLAGLTHWLNDSAVPFKFKSTDLVEFWKCELANYCKEKSTSLESMLSEIPYRNTKDNFSFIDLFAGIGGFKLALEENGGKCVFSSEWDKSAKFTYFNNYGKYPFGDITQFTGTKVSDDMLKAMIPDHQVLAGGFPCQPFSNAGVSARGALGQAHGFECETQGTLFHSIARIAYVKQPEIVFMENVRNIISHNKGETFSVIKETMENLADGNDNKFNYIFHYKVINSDTVVPQRRLRCYMVCVREDVYHKLGNKEFKFPRFDGEKIPLKVALETLSDHEKEEYTISDKLWQGHVSRTQRNIARNTGFTAHLADIEKPSNTIVARYGKDGKECLIPQLNSNPRKLTKRECANLFGYPSDFWLPKTKTPAYKQLGNSVVVPVVARISKQIVKYLELSE